MQVADAAGRVCRFSEPRRIRPPGEAARACSQLAAGSHEPGRRCGAISQAQAATQGLARVDVHCARGGSIGFRVK